MDRHMKKCFLVLVLSLSPWIAAQNPPRPNIEIVESTPIETFLDNPDIPNTREVWLEMIGRAARTLDIEQFYISDEPGKLLQDVLAAIRSAADRGVRVCRTDLNTPVPLLFPAGTRRRIVRSD
jgi:phosphatidylserine/phosphatidylglycerophosphate/cardiolipin synthase-like enzyme